MSVMLPTCPAAPTNVIKHQNETALGATDMWKADEGIHQLDNDYEVKGTLVIEPCAQVRLSRDVTLGVSEMGILRVGAQGGGLAVIDAVDAAKPWHVIYSVKSTSRVELINTLIKNGGSEGANGGGSIYMRGEAALVPTSTILLVDNVRIENSATYGIQLDSNGAFDPASKGLTVTGSKKSPIAMFSKTMGSIPTGTYTGNTNDWFEIDGGGTGKDVIDADTTWVDRGIPIATGFGGLKVGNFKGNAQLTIEPGVIVEMREPKPYMIQVGSSSTDKTPTGAIVAVGTADKPITFRGRGKKRDWAGIGFYGQVDPRSHFDHVVIEDVGGDDSTIGAECVESKDPNLDEGSGAIRFFLADNDKDINIRLDFLRNSTIRHSATNGVLPDFHPGNGLEFCTTNKFEDIDLCNQTAFPFFKGGTNLFCPNAPDPSPCSCE
jgi:hypothetical protein